MFTRLLTWLTPGLLPAAGVGLAVLLLALGAQSYRLKAAHSETAEINAAWSAERARNERIARQAEADARAEEQRRIAAQKEITDAYDRQIQKARADVAVADAAAGRLQQRVAALIAAARETAGDPPAVQAGASASDPVGMLADVLGRCVQRVRRLASIADERGAAGQSCEHSYDALTDKTERTPPTD